MALIDDSTSSSGLSLTGNITLNSVINRSGSASSFSKSGNITLSPQPVENLAGAAGTRSPERPRASRPAPVPAPSRAALLEANPIAAISAPSRSPPRVYQRRHQHQRQRHVRDLSAGNSGNNITFNGNGGNLVFNPGQYQNGGSGNSITLNGNTATTFNAGTYRSAAPSTSSATAQSRCGLERISAESRSRGTPT